MPVEFDDQSLRVFGNNVKAIAFYDDSRTKRAEIYLDSNNNLNIGNVSLVTANTTSDGTPAGVAQAQYLTLAAHADLAAERVFAAGSGLSGLDGGPGGAYTLSVDSTVVRTSRTLSAGDGLQGGGDLSANRSYNVNLGFAFTWTSLHTFNAGARIAAGQNLQFSTDAALSRKAADIIQVNAGDSIESASYASGVTGWRITAAGDAELNNAQIRGELRSTVLTFQELAATAGTFGVFKSAAVIHNNITTPATAGNTSASDFLMQAKNSEVGGTLLAVGDFCWVKQWDGGSNIYSCWLEVKAVGTNQGTWVEYQFRLRSGSTSAALKAGTAIADVGPSGAGFITLSADGAVGSSANMSIITHAGEPWTTQTLHVRLGNLNGSYGTGANNRYGIGIGDFSTGNYLSYNAETTARFVLSAGGGNVAIDGSGVILNFTDAASATVRWRSGGDTYLAIGSQSDGIAQFSAPQGGLILSPGGGPPLSGGTEVDDTDRVYVIGSMRVWTGLNVGSEALSAATGQVILDQAGGDGEILTMRSSDVAHGITDITATSTYGSMGKVGANDGGLIIRGLTEQTMAVRISGFATLANTLRDANARAAVTIDAAQKTGTSVTALGTNGNLVVITNNGVTRFIFDAEGDSHQDVGTAWTNFDTHDDVALLNTLSAHLTRADDPLRAGFTDWLEVSRDPLERMKLVTFNDDGHHFVNWSRMHMLEVGAIRQLAERISRLEESDER